MFRRLIQEAQKSPYLPQAEGLCAKATKAREREKACRAFLATALFRDARMKK